MKKTKIAVTVTENITRVLTVIVEADEQDDIEVLARQAACEALDSDWTYASSEGFEFAYDNPFVESSEDWE